MRKTGRAHAKARIRKDTGFTFICPMQKLRLYIA